MSAHTFPVAPVLRLARVRLGEKLGYLPADGELAEFLGVSIRTVLRWRHAPEAAMQPVMADRCAEALGLHWTEIWPEVAQAEMDGQQERLRAQKAAAMRRWRQRNRDRDRAYRRAYYEANSADVRAEWRRHHLTVDPATGLTPNALRLRRRRQQEVA